MTSPQITIDVDHSPAWVVNMAREYAEANNLAKFSVSEFFATAAYKDQARRNVASAERAMAADRNASR